MHRPVLRFLHRLFVWLGIAAVSGAGGTALYADISQRYQSQAFEQELAAIALVGAADVKDVPDLQEGDVVGRLEIPRLGISVMVLQGTGEATLIAGAGHVPGTPSPGGDGNVVIAAHRDSFFRRLEGIQAGDRIRIATARGAYEYVVESTSVVDPGDTRVMESRGRQELTLITCYPFSFVGAAPTRFVVHARLLTATTSHL
jgi:sortase A